MKKCTNPKCGAENPDNLVFCSSCGKPLPEIETVKPTKKKHSLAAKILMTIAVIGLGLALMPVFGTGIGVLIFGFCMLIPKVWNDEW